MKMLSDRLGVKGRVRVVVRDAETGRIIEERSVENLVVNIGKNHIADLIIGASTDSFTHCAVGSGTTQPTATDLASPIGERKQYTDRFRTNNIATFSFFFSSGDNNGVWSECGLFTAASRGAMLSRALFTPSIVKDSTKTVTVEWDITIG